MINQEFKAMLGAKNVIRELAEYAGRRGAEIGYENVFDFSLGNPSVPVPQAFTDRMIEMLKNEPTQKLHGYSPTLGIPVFKEKIAASLTKRFGLPYTPELIYPTTGAAGAVAHAVRAVTKPGDEVVIFAPFFSEYKPYIEGAGCTMKIIPAQTSDFQLNLDALEEALTDKVMALLINTPNNPSGIVYSKETLTRLAQILSDAEKRFSHPIYLITDEPYREILFAGVEGPYVSSFYKNSLSCYSYAKSMSIPGERMGYVAVHPECEGADVIVPMCGQISRGLGHNCPPSIIQLAVADTCDEVADLSVYETNMNIIYDTLMDLGFTCTKPGGTFYIFPKALEDDAVAFCKKATAYDLILVPSDGFGVPGFFRMAYCIDTEKVERAMPRLRKFVEETYRS